MNPPNLFWRDSKQNKTPTSPFHIGDSLRYTNEGHNDMVEMVDTNNNDPDITNCRIIFLRGNILVVTKESLKSSNVPDIGYIPIYSEDYI